MRLVRGRSKLALALGVCALAAAGAVAGLVAVADGGGSGSNTATAGAYAPISISRPKLYTAGGALLSDPDPGVQAYLTTMLSQLPGTHHYRITITNTSNLGFINAFQWYPPMGVRIVRLLGSSAGHCTLTGLTGVGGNQFKTVVLYPNISCNSANVKPPTCTCLGDGGTLSFSFVADRAMGGAGSARMMSATLVLDPIPSYLTTKTTSQNNTSSTG